MTRRFLTHEELFDDRLPRYATGERRLAAMPLHIPHPLLFLVTVDPLSHEPRVTTATLGPLSWRPYTMSVAIPPSDAVTIEHLKAEGECVMAMPTRDQARVAAILSHPFPNGVCSADAARLTLAPSQRVQAPSIQECHLNLECIIEYHCEYHRYGLGFLRVLGATLDDEVLQWSREQVVARYPLNYVGERVNPDGTAQARLAMMGKIECCPTFPVGHKRGWDTRMRSWLQDLADERYISGAEMLRVLGWVEAYGKLRLDPILEERRELQERISRCAEYAAWQDWRALHKYLAVEGEGARS